MKGNEINIRRLEWELENMDITEFQRRVLDYLELDVTSGESRETNFTLSKGKREFEESMIEIYLKEIGKTKKLKGETLLLAIENHLSGDELSIEAIQEGMLKEISFLALEHSKSGGSYSDLIQEGLLGLVMGLKNIEEVEKEKRIKYLELWIRYFMILANKENIEKLSGPLEMYFNSEKINLYMKENPRKEIDYKDIHEKLGFTQEEFENIEKASSYGFIVKDEERKKGKKYKNILEIDEEIEKVKKNMSVSNLSHKFSEDEIKIATLFYGLDGKRKYHEEISELFGISVKEVKERIGKIVEKLRIDGERCWIDVD